MGYGQKKYTRSTLCCGSCQTTSGCDCRPCRKQPDSNEDIFNSWEFYFGRAFRILPVYYLTLILAILHQYAIGALAAPPDLYFNIGRTLASIFLIQAWIIYSWFTPYGASWTVSTLFFFYLAFPR